MKLVTAIATFLVMGLLPAVGSACNIGDRVVSRNVGTDRENCTTSGYCRAYGYNSKTGRYETYYGYHSRCPGERQRTVESFYCERKTDGSRYRDEKAGPWSYCRAK